MSAVESPAKDGSDVDETNYDYMKAHDIACSEGKHTYIDAVTGLTVFTRLAHVERGKCCGCGCRHCPYKSGVRASKSACDSTMGSSITNTSARKVGNIDTPSSSDSHAAHRYSGAADRQTRRSTKNKVYTKTGDGGTSTLFTGARVSKDAAVFEALGTIDELVSFCGSAHAACLFDKNSLSNHIEQIMKVLMTIASHVATPPSQASKRQLSRTYFGESDARPHICALESWIDDATDLLPDLRSFVLPVSGTDSRACAALHICRSVCRRCERRVLSLGSSVDPAARKYLNRLSDFFFVAARFSGYVSRQKNRKVAGQQSEGTQGEVQDELCYSADDVAQDAKAGLRLQLPRESVDLKKEGTANADGSSLIKVGMDSNRPSMISPGKRGNESCSRDKFPLSCNNERTITLVSMALAVYLAIFLSGLSVNAETVSMETVLPAYDAKSFDLDNLASIDAQDILESLVELGLDDIEGRALESAQIGLREASEAMRVFQQVQEELAKEERELSASSLESDQYLWSALSGIRRHENSMRFLSRVRKQSSMLQTPYTSNNYGYGIVFFGGFRDLMARLFANVSNPKRIVVLGSNLGTEALYFLHLFGGGSRNIRQILQGLQQQNSSDIDDNSGTPCAAAAEADEECSGADQGIHITGIEILCDLVNFASENVRAHGMHKIYPHDRLDFICGDAVDTEISKLVEADIIWIDDQVWDLPLAIKVAEMLRSAPMKKGSLVVDFASAANRAVRAAYTSVTNKSGIVFEEKWPDVEETSELDGSRADKVGSQLYRLSTSWSGSSPGSPVRLFVRR